MTFGGVRGRSGGSSAKSSTREKEREQGKERAISVYLEWQGFLADSAGFGVSSSEGGRVLT